MCFLSKALKISSDLSPLKPCRPITVYPDSRKRSLCFSHLTCPLLDLSASLDYAFISCPCCFRWWLFDFWAHGLPGWQPEISGHCVCPIHPMHWQGKCWKEALVPLPDISKSRSFCCMISEMDRMLFAICMNLCYWCWELSAFFAVCNRWLTLQLTTQEICNMLLWNHLRHWAGTKEPAEQETHRYIKYKYIYIKPKYKYITIYMYIKLCT